MQVSQSGAPYSRLARQARRDAATPAMAATDQSLQARTEQWSPASSAALLQGGRLFQPILTDERLPVAVRLLVSRLQIPVLGVALQEPDLYTDAAHPLRRLLVAVSQEGMWSKDVDARHLDSLLRELSWIVETANRLTGIGGQTRALFEQMVQQFRQRADETGLPVRPATLPG